MNISLLDYVKTYIKSHITMLTNPSLLAITLITGLFFMGFHYLLFSSVNLLAQAGKTLGILDYFLVPLAHLFENSIQFFIVGAIAYYSAHNQTVSVTKSFKVSSDTIPTWIMFGLVQYVFSRTLFTGMPQLSLIVVLIDAVIRLLLLYYATQYALFKTNNSFLAMAESSKLVIKTIPGVLLSLLGAYGLVTIIHLITFIQAHYLVQAPESKLPLAQALLFLDYWIAYYLKIVTLGIFATYIYRRHNNS